MISYPKTLHLRGSKGVTEESQVALSDLSGHLIIEEKMDGTEVALCFESRGQFVCRHRNSPVQGPEFDLWWPWVFERSDVLWERLRDRYVLYGEWLYAKHTVFYDALPSYFMAFDIYDKNKGEWLSTNARRDLLVGTDIQHVRTLYEGPISGSPFLQHLIDQPSKFKTDEWGETLRAQCDERNLAWDRIRNETDPTNLPEGLYIKTEENDVVNGFYKYIREGFLQTLLASESHWATRRLFTNLLAS